MTNFDSTPAAVIAERLLAAQTTGVPIPPVREQLTAGGIESAYLVQAAVTDRWVADGRRIVGRKIGLTSPAVQQQLGVDQPDFGALTADMCLMSGEPVPFGAVIQPRVEAEVALVLSRDLDVPDATLVDLLGAIDYLLPAIEVCGSRIAGWDISILDTIADNASSGMFVLGTKPLRPSDIDLLDVHMELTLDGEVMSTGDGAACLGHPYRAALWLARRLSALGTPLRSGDVVMTGALGKMVPLRPGAEVKATLTGLGEVVTFGGMEP
ncbi:MAG: hypothetical protein RL238_2578 [Actinomycetota bacterium]